VSDFGWWAEQAKEGVMKVQRRSGSEYGRKWEVVEESPNHYIVSDGSPNGEGLAYCLRKRDYEPVQEWVDVTQQCSLLEDGYGRYSLFHNGCAVEASNKRYRVTKNGVVVYKVEVKR
jgi:hypothetical protein